jgi:uncharacterized protein (TIGR02145 family)
MTDMKVPAFTVRFKLPTGITASDSANICIESTVYTQVCENCGVFGSSMIFTPSDIDTACPYKNYENDLLACRKRDSKAGNWEAWIVDPRDCKSYRIVQMPDNRWWMAENLAYTGTTGQTPLNLQYTAQMPVNNATIDQANYGMYWVPTDSGQNNTQAVDAPYSLKNYGALYSWYTAMSHDGNISELQPAMNKDLNTTNANVSSQRRGICPQGWYLPADYDWGVLLNLVEATCNGGCLATGLNSGNNYTGQCYHNYWNQVTVNNGYLLPSFGSTTTGFSASKCAFKDLISVNICPAATLSTIPGNYQVSASTPRCDTREKAYWAYYLPETAGTDKYGFSAIPAGYRSADGTLTTAPTNTAYFYHDRGRSAMFHSSTQTTNATYSIYRAFVYNYRMNADFNSAVLRGNIHKGSGLSVRCIARE